MILSAPTGTSCSDVSAYDKLPDITLSALMETGKAESTIPVLKQHSYTGPRVITSSLANTPCAMLVVGRVLEKLNRHIEFCICICVHAFALSRMRLLAVLCI